MEKRVQIAMIEDDGKVLEVGAALHRFIERGGEKVISYDGKIVFHLRDPNKGISIKTAVDKRDIKVVVHGIMFHSFSKLYGHTGYLSRDQKTSIVLHKKESGVFYTCCFQHEQSKLSITLPYHDMLMMAHEIHGYIAAEEVKGAINGKPLHTMVKVSPPGDNEYIVPFGRLKGKSIAELSNEHLLFISKQVTQDPVALELKGVAERELQKRKSTAN